MSHVFRTNPSMAGKFARTTLLKDDKDSLRSPMGADHARKVAFKPCGELIGHVKQVGHRGVPSQAPAPKGSVYRFMTELGKTVA